MLLDVFSELEKYCQGSSKRTKNGFGTVSEYNTGFKHSLGALRSNTLLSPTHVHLADFCKHYLKLWEKGDVDLNSRERNRYNESCFEIRLNGEPCHRLFGHSVADINARCIKAINYYIDNLLELGETYFKKKNKDFYEVFDSALYIFDPEKWDKNRNGMLTKMSVFNVRMKGIISVFNRGEWGTVRGDDILKQLPGFLGVLASEAGKQQHRIGYNWHDVSERVCGFYKSLQLSEELGISDEYCEIFRLLRRLCLAHPTIVPNESIHGKRRLLRRKDRPRTSLETENKSLEFSKNNEYPIDEKILRAMAEDYYKLQSKAIAARNNKIAAAKRKVIKNSAPKEESVQLEQKSSDLAEKKNSIKLNAKQKAKLPEYLLDSDLSDVNNKRQHYLSKLEISESSQNEEDSDLDLLLRI